MRLGLAAGLGAVLLVCAVLGGGRARTELYGGSHPPPTLSLVRPGDGGGERGEREGQESWLCLGRKQAVGGAVGRDPFCLTGSPHFVFCRWSRARPHHSLSHPVVQLLRHQGGDGRQ
jgi:hypothetical protein